MTVFFPLIASEGGFGINLNLLETNLINLVIVIGVLYWFLKGFLGGMLQRRRETILRDLEDAETRLKSATADLAEAQQELSVAQQKADKIRVDGTARAQAIRLDGEKRTIQAMAALKQDALADLNAEGARLTEELRRQAALAAIDRAMTELPNRLDSNAQGRLIDSSIQSLGGFLMPLLNSLATPYADALLQVTEARKESDEVAAQCKTLLIAWESSEPLRDAMTSPVLEPDAKKKALTSLLAEQITPSFMNLLKVLADRQRLPALEAVLLRYLELYRESRNIALAHVRSAQPLSDEQQAALTTKVQLMAGTNDVEIDLQVDPSLIGGFVVNLGSQVIDASLSGQVRRLGLALAKAS